MRELASVTALLQAVVSRCAAACYAL